MSDEAVAALIGGGVVAVFGLGSLLLNRRFAVKDHNADYREWYRRTLFEKRLEAVGGAHARVMKIQEAIGGAKPDPGQSASQGNRALAEAAKSAREWCDQNPVSLGKDEMPWSSAVVILTAQVLLYANGHPNDRIWKAADDAAELCRKRANELLELEEQSTTKRGDGTRCWIKRFWS